MKPLGPGNPKSEQAAAAGELLLLATASVKIAFANVLTTYNMNSFVEHGLNGYFNVA